MTVELDLKEGTFLVNLARKAVENYLKHKKQISVPENTPKKLTRPHGVFVTIKKIETGKKKLRGCIGYPYPSSPLAQAVVVSAVNSATQDPRFYPLSLNELDKVVFEVSVLTPPQLIKVEKPNKYPANINIGQNGLIVERNVFKGLLLPQVPVELEWNEEEFLSQCCIKASLSPDCWLIKGTKIYKFNAIIFEETNPRGEIKQKPIGGKKVS